MIVRVHKTGSSFKGCAAYLLHDKDHGDSAERVGWVATHNLGTDNPQTAWRVMAATAMKQAELKAAAGLKATGNKAKGTVLHFSLSWEEGAELSKEEMLRAAHGAMGVIGVDPATSKAKNKPPRRQFADEHQAMIVCHTDEKHPHLHVMLNRVHPEHGAILPSSNDRVKLSDWALQYERDRGQVLCPARETNQEMRKRDLYVKGEGNMPRHTWEMTAKAVADSANDNDSPALQRLKAEQKAKADELARLGGEQAQKQRQAWIDLSDRFRSRQKAIRAERAAEVRDAKAASVDEYRTLFDTMRKRHELEREAFKSEERGVIDEISHAWKSVKLLARLRGDDPSSVKFRDYFSPFAGAGAQFELKLKEQAAEKRTLEREQDAKLKDAIAAAKTREKESHQENTNAYTAEKTDLVFVQRMEDAALRAKWKARNEDHRGALAKFAAKLDQREALKDDYARAMLDDYDQDLSVDRTRDLGDEQDDDRGI